MSQDTPLHRLDAQERMHELQQKWQDEFDLLCSLPALDTSSAASCEQRLAAYERMLLDMRGVLP